MKLKLTTLLIAVLSLAGATTGLVVPVPAMAADIENNVCGGANFDLDGSDGGCDKIDACVQKDSNGNCVKTAATNRIDSVVSTIVNLLSIIVGIVAVIMIIIGGFNFVTSNGDAGKVSSAKTTVIYAIVGLIIVALAQVIVRFVLSRV